MKRLVTLAWILLAALPQLSLSAATTEENAPPVRAEAKTHLVVAPEQFLAALTPYLEHKQSQLPTTLVSLESILKDQNGHDDAERLKKYLFKQWQLEQLGYVLLIGDADVMPVRYVVLDRINRKAFHHAFYPSDLYYSDLAKADGTFDDWNAQKDGHHANYFGEVRGERNKRDPINFDQVDYLPDVALGRWPVSTVQEVQTVVEKTINYERSVLSESKPEMRRAALLSVSGWVDTRPFLDQTAETLESSWTVEKLYYADKNRDDQLRKPDWHQVSKLLEEGVGLAIHTGHGQNDCWEQCFSVKTLNVLNNSDRLPVLYSAGCSSGRLAALPPYEPYVDIHGEEHHGSDAGEVFDAPPPPPAVYQKDRFNTTGLGEQLLRSGPHGAVAYIGCNTGSQPCGLTLVEGFTQALGTAKEPRLGDCWTAAVRHYHQAQGLSDLRPRRSWYPPSIFFQAMKFMVYGDPTLIMPGRSDTATAQVAK